MDRRKFLRNGSLSGLGLGMVGGWSRRAGSVGGELLAVGGNSSEKNSSLNLMEKPPALDLEEITVSDLQKKMQSGEANLSYP